MKKEEGKEKREAELVPKKELRAVRSSERQLLDSITKPILLVCDPITKVCRPVFEQHWEERYKKRYPRHAGKLLALDLFLWFLVGALIVTWMFLSLVLPAIPTPSLVDLEITGPASATSGAPAELAIAYRNGTGKNIDCAQVRLRLPEGMFLEEPLPVPDAATKDCVGGGAAYLLPDGDGVVSFPLGNLPAGRNDQLTVTVRPYGPTGSSLPVTAELVFWEEAKTSLSRVFARTELTIAASTMSVRLDIPKNVVRGGQQAIAIAYANRGSEPIDELAIRLSMPDDFRVVGALPPQSGRNEWRLHDLAPGDAGVIRIYGYFRTGSASRAEAPTFTASAFVIADGRELLIEEFRGNADPRASDFELGYEIIGPSGPSTLFPGETVTLKIRYHNRGAEPIKNLSISADPQSAYIENLAPTDLFWDATSNPELAEIASGATGELAGSFTVKAEITPELLGSDERPMVSLTALATYFLEDDLARPIRVDSPVTDIPIATRLTVAAAAFYYTKEGDQLGLGPLPPKAGETTKYWLFVHVSNTTNAVREAWLEAYLPPNVQWTGRYSVTAGEAMDFFPTTGKIRWEIGDIPAYADGDGMRIGASFEVALTPTPDDVGAPALLLKDIKAAGRDEAADVSVHGSDEPLTTELKFDERAAGKGVVRE